MDCLYHFYIQLTSMRRSMLYCCVAGSTETSRLSRVIESHQLNNNSSIDCLLMIIDRISRDVTGHVTTHATPASAATIYRRPVYTLPNGLLQVSMHCGISVLCQWRARLFLLEFTCHIAGSHWVFTFPREMPNVTVIYPTNDEQSRCLRLSRKLLVWDNFW